MAIASELAILLSLKDQASAGLKAASNNADSFGERFKKAGLIAGGALIGAGVAAAGMAVASVKAFADAGDAALEMSQRTGLSTEAISELSHAADMSGTSIEGLEVSVRRMQQTIFDAEQGTGEAVDALGQLGFKIEDLAGLAPEEQFNRLAGAVANIEDPTRKAALAVDIFGRSGTSMLPMLADGAAGLEAMRQEARDLGIVIGQEAAEAADRFNDNLVSLGAAFDGIKFQVAQELLPTLDALVVSISAGLPMAIEMLKPALGFLGDALKFIAGDAANLKTNLDILSGGHEELARAIGITSEEMQKEADRLAELSSEAWKRVFEIAGLATGNDELALSFQRSGLSVGEFRAKLEMAAVDAQAAASRMRDLEGSIGATGSAADTYAGFIASAAAATRDLGAAAAETASYVDELLTLQRERAAIRATEESMGLLGGRIEWTAEAWTKYAQEAADALTPGPGLLERYGASAEQLGENIVSAETAVRSFGGGSSGAAQDVEELAAAIERVDEVLQRAHEPLLGLASQSRQIESALSAAGLKGDALKTAMQNLAFGGVVILDDSLVLLRARLIEAGLEGEQLQAVLNQMTAAANEAAAAADKVASAFDIGKAAKAGLFDVSEANVGALISEAQNLLEHGRTGRERALARSRLGALGVEGFQGGGVIPGPVGAPRLIMAHGGETVSPAGGAGNVSLTVHVAGSVVSERELTQAIRDQLVRLGRRNVDSGLN